MNRFPSIEQFRNVVRNVQTGNGGLAAAPKLTFEGTVKLHGTNAAIVSPGLGKPLQFQSRERVLTGIDNDNAGFHGFFTSPDLQTKLVVAMHMARGALNVEGELAVFGEWCGGNIQKGVGIAGLPKMFVVFAVQADGNWIKPELIKHSLRLVPGVYNITDFQRHYMIIDFERPAEAQNILARLTSEVEESCPVAASFGQPGVGEGIVWRCTEPGWESDMFWFKVKGEKHSATKVRTLASVDVEAVKALSEFIDATCTDARFEQGLDIITRERGMAFEMASVGDFIRWVHGDIVKEESDTMTAAGIDPKKIGGDVAKRAKRWFSSKLDAEAMKS